jgi:hypothetical protein
MNGLVYIMKRFLRTHYELALVAVAVLLLSVVAAALFWEMRIISVSLNKAIGVGSARSPAVRFDLESAKTLDLKTSN